jgi:hypothetical protein
MIDHINLAKLHSKTKCLILSSWWHKSHFFTSMPITFCKVILCENDSTTKIPHKHLCFKQYLHLLNFHLLSTGILGWIKILYMETTENEPLLVRFEWNITDSCVTCTESKRCNKLFNDVCLGPIKLLLNHIFGGKVLNTLAIVSLCVT